MTRMSSEVGIETEKSPLEVAQSDLATIVDSPNPIKTLNELVDSRRGPELNYEESIKLNEAMGSNDSQVAYDARVLLTWHCLPTLSTILEKYTDVIDDPEELFELGINSLQEGLSSWKSNYYLHHHLHKTITYAVERSVTKELGFTIENFELVRNYVRARKEFVLTYEREANNENDLWELLLIMEEGDPGVTYSESDKSKLGIIHNRYYIDPVDLKDSYKLDEDATLLYQLPKKMEVALSTLKPRERYVLEERFMKDKTLRKIAQNLGVTPARISTIEAKALRKLRHPNRNRFIRDYL